MHTRSPFPMGEGVRDWGDNSKVLRNNDLTGRVENI